MTFRVTVAGLAVAAALGGLPGRAMAEGSLSVLTWCDHEDAALLAPFEAANKAKVNFKDISSTAQILAVLGQSKPGDWDVVVLDETDTARLAGMGLLGPLNPSDYPLADMPGEIADPKLTTVADKLYSVPEKFGYNSVAFDKTAVSESVMSDIGAPWDPKYKDKVAVYDYYVPVIQYAALAIGKNPFAIAEADLPAIKDKLAALKANAAMVGDVTPVQQALATGAVDILVGGGEWVTAGLAKDKPTLDYLIPKQGGIRWQQGLAVFATSKQAALGTKFMQYILSPDGQARLATSSCYWGMPANRAATLTAEQNAVLRWGDQPAYLKASYTYLQMTPAMDQKLQALWAQVMQGK